MLKLIWNNILREKADAIVTPASRYPRIGTGLDEIIHEAAGEELLKARMEIGNIGPGIVRETPSFKLKKTTGAKWVIHALGPLWGPGCGIKDELILDGTYLHVLLKVAELGCKTVSIPVMSSGKFGMPMSKAVDVAVSAINTFLNSMNGRQLTVKLVCIDTEFFDYALKKYPAITEKKFTKVEETEYRKKYSKSRGGDQKDSYDEFMREEALPYFQEVKLIRDTAGKSFKELFQDLWEATKRNEVEARKQDIAWHRGNIARLKTRQDLAAAACMTEKTIKNYCADASTPIRPSKDKVCALSVAMKLSVPYAKALLRTCRFSLNRNSPRDEMIEDFIAHPSGDVSSLNLELEANGFQPLQTVKDNSDCLQ